MTAPWNEPRAYLPVETTFAEQHQIDPDEAYRDCVFAEITDGLRLLGYGGCVAVLVVMFVVVR